MLELQIKKHIGKFGIITTKGEFPKIVPGVIKEMDGWNNIWFLDNDGQGYVFEADEVVSFEEEELEIK